MNDGKIKLKLDKYDRGILINALNEFRNNENMILPVKIPI